MLLLSELLTWLNEDLKEMRCHTKTDQRGGEIIENAEILT